jgi:hypothetical protein
MESLEHVAPTEALLFILTCILIGVATKYFLSSLPVPYTALLLVSNSNTESAHYAGFLAYRGLT